MRYKNVLLAATCLLGLISTAMAAPVGMVCKIDGSPSLKSGGRTQALRKLQRLEPGDTVACGGGESAVVVLFASGERYEIGANQKGTVQRTAVAGAKSLGKLGGSSTASELGGSRTGAVMGRAPLSRQHLSRTAPGWLVEGNRKFVWDPIKDATTYTFALLDSYGNILWSTRVASPDGKTPAEPTAEYPADLPGPILNKPYIWRLSAFGESIRPLPESRWGFITWLTPEDNEALTTATRDLQAQADANPANADALQLQKAQIFSDYGVYSNTLDEIEKSQVADKDNLVQTTYSQLGPYVAFLGEASKQQAGELH